MASDAVTSPARSATGVPRPSADTPTTCPTPWVANARAAAPGEARSTPPQTRCAHIRRDHPEDRVRAGEGAVDDVGIGVRAHDDVDAGADRIGEFRRVAHDDAQLFAAGASVGEAASTWLPISPGGCRDDDHASISGASGRAVQYLFRAIDTLRVWISISASSATSPRSPSTGTSDGRPSSSTSRSRCSAGRSARSSRSSAARCSCGRRAAWCSHPRASSYARRRAVIFATVDASVRRVHEVDRGVERLVVAFAPGLHVAEAVRAFAATSPGGARSSCSTCTGGSRTRRCETDAPTSASCGGPSTTTGCPSSRSAASRRSRACPRAIPWLGVVRWPGQTSRASRSSTRTSRRTSSVEEKFELIASGHGIALVPRSVAQLVLPPDLVYRPGDRRRASRDMPGRRGGPARAPGAATSWRSPRRPWRDEPALLAAAD